MSLKDALLSPTGRLLRLKPAAAQALLGLSRGEGGAAARTLSATLIDAGAAHPLPAPASADEVTVVIPVKDRPRELDRCLAALKHSDVLVVDDGSADPDLIERIASSYGARVVHRANGGPAAARNTAEPLLHRGFVAFLDSDCVPPVGWLEDLMGHFEDPEVGMVAPRVTGGLRSPLDLGVRPGVVRPGYPVAYVPTAALVVRREALTRFDEDLRYGEDVDLIWRTVAAGWQVRYDPRVVVHHDEPATLTDRLLRRFRYGTSAAPLSQRHPDAVTHLVAPPWPTAAVVLLLAKRPALAAGAALVTAARLQRVLGDPVVSTRLTARSVQGTAEGWGRALSLLGPLAWVVALKRPQLVGLLVLPWVLEQRERRPGAEPVSYAATALLEQSAYGAGVVWGCLEHRTARPLLPRAR